MTQNVKSPDEGLKRAIGPTALAANVINLTIGAGIFVLPAKVYESLGAASILAYLICGVLIFLVMLCFAEVGSRVTRTGGAYAYVESAYGPFFGFITSNLYWFGFGLISDAAIINAMAEMLSTVYAPFHHPVVKGLFFTISFLLLGYINVRGVKYGSQLVEFITFAKLLPLVLLILVGWTTVETNNLNVSGWPGWTNLGEASLILFFAYGGAEASLTVSGEIKNPGRTVPIGILWGIFIVVIIYATIHLITQGILGSNLLEYKDAPLSQAASLIFGPAGVILILVCAAISIWGAISGDILTMPRFLFAASQDKLFPSFLSKIHPRYATPYWSIIIYAGLGLLFSLLGGFKQLALLSSAAILITYLAVILSAIKLRIDGLKSNGFVIPGGLTIHFIALSTIIWFLTHLSANELWSIAGALTFFSVVYYFRKKYLIQSEISATQSE